MSDEPKVEHAETPQDGATPTPPSEERATEPGVKTTEERVDEQKVKVDGE